MRKVEASYVKAVNLVETNNSSDNHLFQDLIESVVSLQDMVEKQAKKQKDLEDYIDSLLMKVIASNPDVLEKNAVMNEKYGRMVM